MNARAFFLGFLVWLSAGSAVLAQTENPKIHTNQSYIEDVTRSTKIPDEIKQVFGMVFASLPDRVTVYPTENYYYFYFYHGGVRYAGNIRLDPENREQGKLSFAYFTELNEWNMQASVKHALLGKGEGIGIEKVESLLYRITSGNKSVLFALNDLSNVSPPPSVLGPDDKFIGPIFDESGIRFFLVFNAKLKLFHYLLDETVPVADELVAAKISDRIVIGRRTGFAYYRDERLNRKILIGVFDTNSEINNYFDGPFDQLPDNFIKGNELHDAIVAVDPSQKGKIDRYGNSPDGASRYLIAPYIYYRDESDLEVFDRCAKNKKIAPDLYHACFVMSDASNEPKPVRKPSVKGLR